MSKFPVDAPKDRVVKTLQRLGFGVVREREHIAMVRENSDGTRAAHHAKSSADKIIDSAIYLPTSRNPA